MCHSLSSKADNRRLLFIAVFVMALTGFLTSCENSEQSEPQATKILYIALNPDLKDVAVEELDTLQKQINDKVAKQNIQIRLGRDENNRIRLEYPSTNHDSIIDILHGLQEKLPASPDIYLRLATVHPDNYQLQAQNAECPPGYRLYEYHSDDDYGKRHSEKLYISEQSVITSKHIESCSLDYSRKGYVNVTLTDEGAKRMFAETSDLEHGRDRLAIIFNEQVTGAPVVQTALSHNFQISGLDQPNEAENAVHQLTAPQTIWKWIISEE